MEFDDDEGEERRDGRAAGEGVTGGAGEVGEVVEDSVLCA